MSVLGVLVLVVVGALLRRWARRDVFTARRVPPWFD